MAKAPRCPHCGEFMRKEPSTPSGYACSQMIYIHAQWSWEHR